MIDYKHHNAYYEEIQNYKNNYHIYMLAYSDDESSEIFRCHSQYSIDQDFLHPKNERQFLEIIEKILATIL